MSLTRVKPSAPSLLEEPSELPLPHLALHAELGEVDTCYSYDPHGNISSLLQRVPDLGDKRIDYDYDILDGKIGASHYQSDAQDVLHHRYTYDEDRRLWKVK